MAKSFKTSALILWWDAFLSIGSSIFPHLGLPSHLSAFDPQEAPG
jgi:hypothetical protein